MMNFSMRGSVQLGRVDGRERVAKPISREVSFRRDDPLPVGSTVLRTSPVVVRIAALAERQPGLRAARVAQMSDPPSDVEPPLDVERQRPRNHDAGEVEDELTER